ncbi:MAG: hypothetical protein CMK60_11540 [Proteobacteria bacterium]|jgi:two-component system sensor histidine kinase ChiS|nr:hypothetical protein [Pseudomonadota bacterium]|tara:strand:+ start:339 stop:1748 length:1410 start_codon:yes stop_codon:yes gene_type:complete
MSRSSILVVDDSRTIRSQVLRILSGDEDDYALCPQENGQQALQWLSGRTEAELPDLILLDRNMPEVSGDECIRILKKDEAWKQIPVLFLTAQSDVKQLVHGLAELEADDYLAKPFDPDELRARVKALIRVKTAEDQTRQLNKDLEKSLQIQKKAFSDLKETKLQLAETEAAVRLTRVFEKFVPKEFLKRIAPEGLENLKFGQAESDFKTILFSDIRAFTKLSESYSPQELLDFLNDYLRMMNPAIMDHHGFVDKFIGDAIMAIFDRPDQSDAAEALDAVDAALSMLGVLGEINTTLSAGNKTRVEIGIGIHSGNVIIGTVGFEERMDSTVLGDTVNLASRLESLTKFYGCPLIVSETTMELIGTENRHQVRELDLVSVKGRLEPLHIYEVFDGDRQSKREAKLESRDDLDQGIRLYRERRWDDALDCFENCNKIHPDDPLIQIYKGRCRHNTVEPPAQEWDGVHIFDHK